MTLTESKIEEFLIELLKTKGYEYIHGVDIAPDAEHPERSDYSDVVLLKRLNLAIDRLNPRIPQETKDHAVRQLLNIMLPYPIDRNEYFHRMLTDGIDVEYQKDGITRGDKLWLVDFDNPQNNEFLVVNQFTVIENNCNKRPDVVLFVNGLPLVVIELKNAIDEKADIKSAFKQLQTYKNTIMSLFTYNALLIITDGLDARVGSLSAGFNRFNAWKTKDGKSEASKLISQMEVMVEGLLNKSTLLDLIRYFTVFEKRKGEDPETGLPVVASIKKIAAYHQYYAVNKAVEKSIKASSQDGSRKGGVVWHTQGSGKSLSMVFFAGKLIQKLNNPTIVILTDRNDLDDQLFDTFAASRQLLRQDPAQAENRYELIDLLKVASGGVVFTTIYKFSPENGEAIYPLLSERKNIVVIADEAHRSQYGFKAKEVDLKDKEGNIVGKKTAYGFAKYIRDALPNATFVGFTGTPIEFADKNTPAVFGDYVDVYDIAQAVEDGATVRIFYESRLAKVNISEEGKELIKELDDDLDHEDLSITEKVKAKYAKLEAIIGSEQRLKNIAQDIVNHFEARQEVFTGKAMIVTMSRLVAVRLFDQIKALRPKWINKDLDKGEIKIVMTSSSSDDLPLQAHHTSKSDRRVLADRFKDDKDPLKLVIVCDMWLTGFDVPCLHTLYLDKPMKGHNLMQAIARVNRVYKDKPGGLVVDYLGIASDLKKALSFYSESGGKGNPTEKQEEAINVMLEKLEVVEQMFSGFNFNRYFTSEVAQKLNIILEAEEHVLKLEKGKDRYLKEVTTLSKAFALAVPSDEAMNIKEKVSFFQAVKARLNKFETIQSSKTSEDIESAIRQVIDKAIVSDKVIDIFDAAGIKKPDISILSEEFMEEIKGMKHKNLALELLKKLLKDEIRTRTKKNLVQSKKLSEMLEDAVKKYQNKLITAAEVIDELIKLAKEIKEADKRGEELKLSEYELAFYDALSMNNSAKDVMGQDKLRELAIVLVEKVKENRTIDWSIRDSVRSRMKVIVRRLLRKYGYPPDMQALATELVLKQTELFCEWEGSLKSPADQKYVEVI